MSFYSFFSFAQLFCLCVEWCDIWRWYTQTGGAGGAVVHLCTGLVSGWIVWQWRAHQVWRMAEGEDGHQQCWSHLLDGLFLDVVIEHVSCVMWWSHAGCVLLEMVTICLMCLLEWLCLKLTFVFLQSNLKFPTTGIVYDFKLDEGGILGQSEEEEDSTKVCSGSHGFCNWIFKILFTYIKAHTYICTWTFM